MFAFNKPYGKTKRKSADIPPHQKTIISDVLYNWDLINFAMLPHKPNPISSFHVLILWFP